MLDKMEYGFMFYVAATLEVAGIILGGDKPRSYNINKNI